jgi:N-acetylated-alpha-linked acidic dipeptidase
MRETLRRVLVHAVALDSAIARRLREDGLRVVRVRELNDLLARMEQLLTDDDGAPDRNWYRHVVHGWNIYSLYDGQPFPGLAEAIRVGDTPGQGREVARIEKAFERLERALVAARQLAGEGIR